MYGTNTHIEDFMPRRLEGAGEVALVLEDLRLVEGTYLLDVAAHRRDGTPYDYHRGLYTFRVKSRIKDVGVYRPVPPLVVLGRDRAGALGAAAGAGPARGGRRRDRTLTTAAAAQYQFKPTFTETLCAQSPRWWVPAPRNWMSMVKRPARTTSTPPAPNRLG